MSDMQELRKLSYEVMEAQAAEKGVTINKTDDYIKVKNKFGLEQLIKRPKLEDWMPTYGVGKSFMQIVNDPHMNGEAMWLYGTVTIEYLERLKLIEYSGRPFGECKVTELGEKVAAALR